MQRTSTLALWIGVPSLLLICMGLLFYGIRNALNLSVSCNPASIIAGVFPGLLIVILPIGIALYLLKKTYPDIQRRRAQQRGSVEEHPCIETHHDEYSPPPTAIET